VAAFTGLSGFGSRPRSIPLSTAQATLKLSVADERSTKSLGHTEGGDEFTVQGKLTSIIESSIRSALEQQGFTVSRSGKKGAPTLQVDIKDLQYRVEPGFILKTIRATSGINAVCKSASGGEFVRGYNGSLDKTVIFLSDDRNRDYLSAAVSQAVDKLLNDPGLAACLAEQPSRGE
jgi:uncharacterized lipoprotein YajG